MVFLWTNWSTVPCSSIFWCFKSQQDPGCARLRFSGLFCLIWTWHMKCSHPWKSHLQELPSLTACNLHSLCVLRGICGRTMPPRKWEDFSGSSVEKQQQKSPKTKPLSVKEPWWKPRVRVKANFYSHLCLQFNVQFRLYWWVCIRLKIFIFSLYISFVLQLL